MFQRPDPQSFSRFLASIGFFLCVAGFVAPGVILRETDVLRIKTNELDELTSVAKEELERRQRVARDVAKGAPIGGGIVGLIGLGLLIYAAPQMRRQERRDEQRSDAELEQLRKQLPPQSQAEREARIQDEVAAEAEIPADEPAPVEPGRPRDASRQSMVQRYADVERRVLDRLAEIAGRLYELRPQVRLRPTGTLLDGVLVSSIDQLPDIVVEIKLRRPGSLGNSTRNAIDETLARVARYRALASPTAIGWLILVVDGEISTTARQNIKRASAEVANDIRVSLVEEDKINTLELPPGPWQ